MKKKLNFPPEAPHKQILDRIDSALNEFISEKGIAVTITNEKFRSNSMSTRFHAHLTTLHKHLVSTGVTDKSREYLYYTILLKACEYSETELFDGMAPYPYRIIKDQLIPKRTSECTNNQLLTAYKALEEIANYYGCILPEKELI